MKKPIAFIVLLCHINFTMFFPTVKEYDLYTSNGIMIDEINSVYEYVDEDLFGDKDESPDDEDDDEPDFYELIKIGSYYFHNVGTELTCAPLQTYSKLAYPAYIYNSLLSLSYDVVAPPPKQFYPIGI
jgi:hypothetical protein